MNNSSPFLLKAVDAMATVAAVSYRRIFNGFGIYHQHVQFAIVIHDRLYFRADEDSRNLYLEKNMSAFLPGNMRVEDSNFFQLPEAVLDSPDELRYWMRIAVEAAMNSYSLEDDEQAASVPVKHMAQDEAAVNHSPLKHAKSH